jgi:ferredoxin-NADP reductase
MRDTALRPKALGRRILRSGLLDALAAPHGAERYLELVRPRWSLRDLRAEVTAVRHPAPGSVTLTLRPNHLWDGFEPGQFVRCTVEIDGSRHARCYSPASSAHRRDGQIEVTARSHRGGLVSRFLHDRATRGMLVGLEPAGGDFVLPAIRPAHLALISGGSGITPVMSMLRTLLDEGHRGRIAFLHYSPTPDHVPYAPELGAIAARAANVSVGLRYTRTGGGAVADGYFQPDHLDTLAPDLEDAATYVCGPRGLIDAVRDAGGAARVRSESFTLAAPATGSESDSAGGAVRFARSAIDAPNTGATLLVQAEAAGLKPVHGCRMGICHTCTCRKLGGEVRNLLTGAISSAEGVDIQLCVSVPTGSITLDL